MSDTSQTDTSSDTTETVSPEAFQAQQAKIADLTDKLDKLTKQRADRPKASADQLKDQLGELLGLKDDAATTRDPAKALVREATEVADAAAQEAKEVKAELRRLQIVDAARDAKAVEPADIGLFLAADDDRPIGEQVADLKKTKPHLFKSTPADPDFNADQDKNVSDPGLRDLYAEIRESRR